MHLAKKIKLTFLSQKDADLGVFSGYNVSWETFDFSNEQLSLFCPQWI